MSDQYKRVIFSLRIDHDDKIQIFKLRSLGDDIVDKIRAAIKHALTEAREEIEERRKQV